MADTSIYTGVIPQPHQKELTGEDILKLINKTDSKAANEWMLISPSGNIYIGDIAKIAAVLMQHHPLMNPMAKR